MTSYKILLSSSSSSSSSSVPSANKRVWFLAVTVGMFLSFPLPEKIVLIIALQQLL
jgi:hypothetical protein